MPRRHILVGNGHVRAPGLLFGSSERQHCSLLLKNSPGITHSDGLRKRAD